MDKSMTKTRTGHITQLVWRLLRQEREEYAWELVRQLKVVERIQPLHVAIDVLLQRSHLHLAPKAEARWLDEAIYEVATLASGEERDRLWQRLAVVAAYHGDRAQAQHLAFQIGDEVVRSYALSAIIQALAHKGDYGAAQKLLLVVMDAGAREDAITALVKELCYREHTAELIALIDGLVQPGERTQAAKVWRSALLAKHRRPAAQALQRRYVPT